MEEQERLVYKLIGDGTSYQRMLTQAQSQTAMVTASINRSFAGVGAGIGQASLMIGGLGRSVLGMLGIATVFEGVRSSFSLAAEFEQNTVAFQTMLQSAEAGSKLVKDIQQFAAVTPMTTRDLLSSSRTLLQFGKAAGVSQDNVIQLMSMIGDVTGGNSQKFQAMSLAFGQMLGMGRLMGQDLLQMINAGFNPMQALGEMTGKTTTELMKMKEAGQISSKMVVQAFAHATKQGGQFGGMMKQQSQTMSGLFSTLQDNVQIALQKIGETLVEQLNIKPIMSQMIEAAGEFGKWLENLSPTAKRVAAAVVMIVVAVVALKVAIFLAGSMFNLMFGGLGLIVGIIVVAAAAVIEWLGGVEALKEAWASVREAVEKAWAWLKPVRQAFFSFASTVGRRMMELWGHVQEWAAKAWDSVKKTVGKAWDSIFGDTKMTWGEIRGEIVDVILAAEYAVINLGDTWDLVTTGAALSFVRFSSHIEHFFTEVMPALITSFTANWKQVGVMFTKLMNGDIAGFAAGLGTELMKVDVPKRAISGTEKELQKELDNQLAKMGAGFDKFREDRLKEFNKEPEGGGGWPWIEKIPEKALNVGQDAGEKIKKGMSHGLKDLDAVLFNSAEALSRMNAYRDMVRGTGGGRGFVASSPVGIAGRDVAAQMVGMDRQVKDDLTKRTPHLLEQILVTLNRIHDKDGFVFSEVDL